MFILRNHSDKLKIPSILFDFENVPITGVSWTAIFTCWFEKKKLTSPIITIIFCWLSSRLIIQCSVYFSNTESYITRCKCIDASRIRVFPFDHVMKLIPSTLLSCYRIKQFAEDKSAGERTLLILLIIRFDSVFFGQRFYDFRPIDVLTCKH